MVQVGFNNSTLYSGVGNLVITAILTEMDGYKYRARVTAGSPAWPRKRRLWDSDYKAEAILLAASSTPTLCINAALTNVLTLTTGTGIGTATRLQELQHLIEYN
jgi:hypothetical protein